MDKKLALILLAALILGGLAVVYVVSKPTPVQETTPNKASTDFHKTVPIQKRDYQQ